MTLETQKYFGYEKDGNLEEVLILLDSVMLTNSFIEDMYCEIEFLFRFIFNSRSAIAEAIIGLLLVFYNSKNLNCIGALSFYNPRIGLYWCSVFFFIFVRCFHTSFHDFELSKRDKQVKLSGHQVSLEARV